jgi:5-methylcytosine-specific restriction protein A
MESDASNRTRNPAWQRDELILALDLYFSHNPRHIDQRHAEVIRLSDTLNALPIHHKRPDEERFRNANGVYMKLCNFLRFDPSYTGVGLRGGGKLEQEIWDEFSDNQHYLHMVAESIRRSVSEVVGKNESIQHSDDDEEEEFFPEGKVLYRVHRSRERNPKLTRKAKQIAMKKDGHLQCACCGFDFSQKYGVLGEGYIECCFCPGIMTPC